MEEPVVRELIVTGPLRGRLYDLFTQVYEGRSDVRVVMDRRHGDQRSAPQSDAPRHRGTERRSGQPAWIFPPPD